MTPDTSELYEHLETYAQACYEAGRWRVDTEHALSDQGYLARAKREEDKGVLLEVLADYIEECQERAEENA